MTERDLTLDPAALHEDLRPLVTGFQAMGYDPIDVGFGRREGYPWSGGEHPFLVYTLGTAVSPERGFKALGAYLQRHFGIRLAPDVVPDGVKGFPDRETDDDWYAFSLYSETSRAPTASITLLVHLQGPGLARVRPEGA